MGIDGFAALRVNLRFICLASLGCTHHTLLCRQAGSLAPVRDRSKIGLADGIRTRSATVTASNADSYTTANVWFLVKIGSPGGPRSRTDRVKACYAAHLHHGGISFVLNGIPASLPRRDSAGKMAKRICRSGRAG